MSRHPAWRALSIRVSPFPAPNHGCVRALNIPETLTDTTRPQSGIPKVRMRGTNPFFEQFRLNRIWPVLQIYFVSFIDSLLVIASQGGRRERYPLTSQLIEENKIPEFGMSSQHPQIHSISRAHQTTSTSTLMESFITVRFHLKDLELKPTPLRLAPQRRRRALQVIRGADFYLDLLLCGSFIWKDKAEEIVFHGCRRSCSACEDEPATEPTVQNSQGSEGGQGEG